MKVFIFLATICVFNAHVTAQTNLSISNEITTTLVFSTAITHIDRGSAGILVQRINDANNIVLIKSSKDTLRATNLSVITDDGEVHSFLVDYTEKPSQWIYYIPATVSRSVESFAKGILDNPRTMRSVRDKNWDIVTEVTGIYVKESILYYQLQLTNQSPLNFDIEVIRFFVKDKKRAKRTSIQEKELTPVHVVGNTKQVGAYGSTTIVLAFEKLTIPDKKYLGIQIMERNGGRHLAMRLGNKKLLQARILPSMN